MYKDVYIKQRTEQFMFLFHFPMSSNGNLNPIIKRIAPKTNYRGIII